MARLIVYFAHPGHKHSHVNRHMAKAAAEIDDITFVDLYQDYPRFDIDVDIEQQRLLEHDVIVFQFPMFWYSTPSMLKEWQDIVLEHGFAYGKDGDKLAGKTMLLAITAAGPEDAYTSGGYQHYALRDFLRPLEQTARLCGMHFATPFALYAALRAPSVGEVEPHVSGYVAMLEAIRDDCFDWGAASESAVLGYRSLPNAAGA